MRVDDAYLEGMDIPIYYDPMIAKLIVHGANRTEAIAKMIRAIDEYHISGITTTLPFCNFVLHHDAFISGNFDTNFVKLYFKPEYLKHVDVDEMRLAALVALRQISKNINEGNSGKNTVVSKISGWKPNRN